MSHPALLPVPAAVSWRSTPAFALTETTAITGPRDAGTAVADALATRTGVRPRLATADPGDAASGPAEGAIDLRVEAGGAPESYRIRVDADRIAVTAPDAAGLFYAAQTLAQLATSTADGWTIAAVDIDDAPRFGYRGVMLDVARHFHSVATVRAFIDRAALLKFNHLHLHLSDDQGWRLALRSRPELTAHAAGTSVGGDPGGFYTQDDWADIVAYAAARHLTVVPEIDVPGHTHAVGLAYPALAADPVLSEHVLETVAAFGGAEPTPGVAYDGMAVGFSSLKIHDEATYAFLADVFGELARLTPGPYLHVGGDEALGTPPEDFALFMSRVTRLVADLGKTPITWHEAGAAAGLAPDTIGQYWGFVTPTDGMDEKTRTFVRNGAQVILSPADAIYLDMKETPDSPLGLTWANGTTSLERAYAWEPTAIVAGIGEGDILGVEAPLWTETVRDLDDIDQLAFPRITAAAEVAWSPQHHPDRTWTSFAARVAGQAAHWDAAGIRYHRSAQVAWDAPASADDSAPGAHEVA